MKSSQILTRENIYLSLSGNQSTYIPKDNPPKTEADNFQMLNRKQEAKEQWALQFSQLIDKWDEPIRQVLNELASIFWPPEYVLGLIPVSSYRLRDQQVDEIHLWWIEHDIAPYDKYQCATYEVSLILDSQDQPALIVHSGVNAYPVTPLTAETLKTTVAKAGQDPPLIAVRGRGNGYP